MKLKSLNVSKFVPRYDYHVDEDIIYLADGKMIAPLFIEGFAFETLEDSLIVAKFNDFKNYLVGMGKQGGLFIWSHIVKRKVKIENTYQFNGNDFLQGFYDKYINSLSEGDFFRTDYILTLGISVSATKESIQDGIDTLKEMIQQTQSVLSGMNVKTLGLRDEYISSIASDYLSYLINHKEVDIPLSGTKIKDAIPNSDVFFGFDVAEIRLFDSNESIYCANYVVKDFPRVTKIGQWDFLLKLPYEFILTQSFLVESPVKTIKRIDAQINKLASANDAAVTQQAELEIGQENVQDGTTLFGSYHAVLTVFGQDVRNAKDNGIKVTSEFITEGKGFRFIKSTSEAPFTYFSHLPMNKYRPLPSQRSLTNFACLFSLHNFSYGKARGNPIGDGTAIMPLKTVSDTLYYFNTHYSDPYKDVRGQRIAGHMLLLGATGAGKTTLEGAATAFLQRFEPDMFVIDYNRSTELFVRAFGGQYFTLAEGEPTGLNPFQIGNADDLELMAFLKQWVKRGAIFNNGSSCTDEEAEWLDKAVDAVMGMPLEERRFGDLLGSLPDDSDVSVRLKKWCGSGALSWALDSPKNTFNPANYRKVGFDTTVILERVGGKDHPACEMILSVLFFYKNRMQKEGKLMLTIIEEFWKPANFPMTQEMIKSSLKAGRLKGEVVWLISQSPEDAVNCEIFPAIVQQTSTKVCLPNPDAKWSGYKNIGLTPKEFNRVKALRLESRTMLIKQSNSSVLAKMDLYGFDDYLPVLSGTQKGIALCEKIRNELNTDNPNVWIPVLLDRLAYDF